MPPDTSKALCTLVSLTSLVYINILYGPIWTHMVVCLSQIFLGISIDFPTCSTLAILRTLAASPHEGHGHGMTWKGDRWRPCPEPVPPSNFSMSVGLSRFLPRKPTSRRRLHHISAFQFQLSTSFCAKALRCLIGLSHFATKYHITKATFVPNLQPDCRGSSTTCKHLWDANACNCHYCHSTLTH